MKENRRHWYAGLSPANIITLFSIVVAGSVGWGLQVAQTSTNTEKVRKLEADSKQELKETEKKITEQIKSSEQRTNERINRMENRLGGDMKELKRLIINK